MIPRHRVCWCFSCSQRDDILWISWSVRYLDWYIELKVGTLRLIKIKHVLPTSGGNEPTGNSRSSSWSSIPRPKRWRFTCMLEDRYIQWSNHDLYVGEMAWCWKLTPNPWKPQVERDRAPSATHGGAWVPGESGSFGAGKTRGGFEGRVDFCCLKLIPLLITQVYRCTSYNIYVSVYFKLLVGHPMQNLNKILL